MPDHAPRVFKTRAFFLLSRLTFMLVVVLPCGGFLTNPAFGQATQSQSQAKNQTPIQLPASPDSPDWPKPETPTLRAASEEGQQAIAQFKFPESLECKLYAAEPAVANIVAIKRDYQGRMFVCETYRQDKGVEDNRAHQNWMDDELAAQTIADRIRYIRKHIPDADKKYTENDDRIRLLQDTTGDGVADSSKVFADHFNRIDMGTGAGVLSYRNKVYYTCIPDLFALTDSDKDGVADKRESLHTGFGVHFAFRGHDMHGLIIGHDGRLYFSIGDRGYNVPESPFNFVNRNLDSGAVFRCEFNGSNLEVVATGLRNPQELAFDDYGNLFTGDNNSDSGDKARFTEIVKGGDSGWRMYYQYIGDRGPFNREKIWHTYNDDTPAYIIPPIANIADGPAGLEYYPGTGFGDQFKDRFFLCDFRGTSAISGVRSFKLAANGASWKLEDEQQPIWSILTTDLDFGSDGKLYVADWVEGWQGVKKGRIYSFHDKEHFDSKLVREVESLLKNGLKDKTPTELSNLLNHADRRVRLEAQFELASRHEDKLLISIAVNKTAPTLARVHALFGIGQITRSYSDGDWDFKWLEPVLEDTDDQVVISATRLYAEPILGIYSEKLAPLLQHTNPRVRFAATMAIANSGGGGEAVFDMLIENNNQDPMLRHAASLRIAQFLTASPDFDKPRAKTLFDKLTQHESAAVRIATCVAIRKRIENLTGFPIDSDGDKASIEYSQKLLPVFLNDPDPKIILEAARAIHDVPVNSAMPALAELIDSIELHHDNDPLIRRILNANFRVGTKESVDALAAYCVSPKADPKRRLEVIQWLAEWANPPARDKVLHAWRPLDPTSRDKNHAQEALLSIFGKLTQDTDEIAVAAIDSAGALGLTNIGPELLTLAKSNTSATSTRIAALNSLDKLQDPKLPSTLAELAATNKLDSNLLTVVAALTAKRDATAAMPLITAGLARDEQTTSQALIATLGTMDDDASNKILADAIKAMTADKYSPELRLDVITAAKQRKLDSLNELLSAYETARNKRDKDPLVAARLDTSVGGDLERGKDIFYNKTAVSCIRCHKIGWDGGNVGPELTDLGSKHDRRYIIEAIANPNAVIAKGYDQQKVLTDDGTIHIGILKESTDDQIILLDSDGKEIMIDQDTVEATKPGLSSMPTNLHELLTPNELRDLVEYLANQKVDPKADAEPAPVQ